MKKLFEREKQSGIWKHYFGVLTEEQMTIWSLADIYIQLGHEGIHTEYAHVGGYIKRYHPNLSALKEKWNKYLFFFPRSETLIEVKSVEELMEIIFSSLMMHQR